MSRLLRRTAVGGRSAVTVWRAARRRPAAASLGLLRRLPGGPRSVVARTLIGLGSVLAHVPALRGHGAAAAAVGLAATGRRNQARERLTGLAEARGDRRRRLAATALAIGDPAFAVNLAGLPETPADAVAIDPDAALVVAEARLAAGAFSQARELAAAYLVRRPDDRFAALLGRRIGAELRVRDPAWRPTTGIPSRPATPVRGRVLHLLTNSLPDHEVGYTIRSHEIARSQVRVGLEPHLATRAGFPLWEGRRRAPAEEHIDGITYHRLAPQTPIDTPVDAVAEATARAGAWLVERLRPAVLHAASNHLNGQVALALRDSFGLPVVYEVRGFLEESWRSRAGHDAASSERYRLTRDVETAVMLAADAVVTLSDTMRDEIVGRGVPADKVAVVPNAVDADRFRPEPPDPGLRQRLGLAAGLPVVGYVSTLTAFEGIDLLLEAIALLRGRGRRLQGLLVGDGPAAAPLRATAARLGLADGTVVFAGRIPREQIERFYALIDVFVVPRTDQRVSELVTPLKPYEAMATQRAVVVSDVGALREIVTDGRTGLLFRAGDAVALANRIEALLDDPAVRTALGEAARRWVVEHRTWAANGRCYRDLYARLGAI